MPNNKIILGLVGEMAAGKSTATEYLKKKYGAVSFRFSDALRDVLERLHVENSRPNLQALSTFLRQQYGEDLLSKVMALDVEQSSAPLIITEGIRRPTDTVYLRKFSNFHIMALNAAERTRYERLTKRSENADDKSKTWEQFQADGRAESEQKIKEIAVEADFKIDNSGTVEQLHKQIDTIVKKLQSQLSFP
ncbi:MAG: AAA family ATPase [Candidatus Magasanikbacteria bacterium]|nr:AAA family ATPase [Candidatus Magasanikbacteria bacterium]